MSETTNPPAPVIDELAALRRHAEQLEQNLDRVRMESNTRVIHAELKAEAVRAGIVDMDGLRLLDPSDVTMLETGEVAGVAEAMNRFRQSKPWLFGILSSSSTSVPPAALPPQRKLATDMTDAEYRAARAAILKQRV